MITNPSSAEQQQNISEPATVKMRIESLDVLRGIAVLAALFVSIWIFGGFSNQQQNQLLLQSKGWNFRVFAVVELLFDGKMRALISLVFGAAMILFLAKENAPGQLPARGRVAPASGDLTAHRARSRPSAPRAPASAGTAGDRRLAKPGVAFSCGIRHVPE